MTHAPLVLGGASYWTPMQIVNYIKHSTGKQLKSAKTRNEKILLQ